GLAGLALGIGLRQREIPVVIFEAGKYPRHRVCGEFISGHGQNFLARLGLSEKLFLAGARWAETTGFFSARSQLPVQKLPEPALCLSRFTLDDLLAKEFQNLGGELKENCRWKNDSGEGIVRASGRRIQAIEKGWRWFGLKIHAENIALAADLEMHLTKNGYVGLCRLNENKVNICGLFRSRTTLPDLAQNWKNWLAGPPNSFLQERLKKARFDENSFCSVAGLSLQPGRPALECSLGDAFRMIPPVTGNGMSLAFESAELAIEPLRNYSLEKSSWSETKQLIAQRCDRAFGRRLFFASWLQKGLFQPGVKEAFLVLASRGLWPAFFKLTR
ncbi:MAG: NAD(P)/FAD-dependent oxidoreductase, partial [Limisphaerales bacterium]